MKNGFFRSILFQDKPVTQRFHEDLSVSRWLLESLSPVTVCSTAGPVSGAVTGSSSPCPTRRSFF